MSANQLITVFISGFLLLLSAAVNAGIDKSALIQSESVGKLIAQKAGLQFIEAISSGQELDVIVLYKGDKQGLLSSDIGATQLTNRYQKLLTIKSGVLSVMPKQSFTQIRDFSLLPMNQLILKSNQALITLLANDRVEAVYHNARLKLHLNQSLPLVQQQEVSDLGVDGSGTTVVILDSGVDYTQAIFGSCSAPGVPSSCRVKVSMDISPDDNVLDDIGHGTNVAGIVAATAPGTSLAVLDVLDGAGVSSSDVIAGINWAISNKDSYSITAINLSLGGAVFSNPCSSGNPFVTPVASARSMGIAVLASSGNDADSNGVAIPACTPGVVSVGAVYDSSLGKVTWSVCADEATTADQIGCFSNSDTFLSVLAPGALITSAGMTMGGTSQAAPHVSGAAALLRSAYPSIGIAELEQKLLQSTTLITDSRNGITIPRLNLFEVIGSINDSFSYPLILSSPVKVSNIDATKEVHEPNHSGQPGGASVWWLWTADSSDRVCFDTAGSEVDTLLAVYTGSSLSALTEVASNDDIDGLTTSRVCFFPVVGQEYRVVVDSIGGDIGIIQLTVAIEEIPEVNIDEDIPLPLWALALLAAVLARCSRCTR